MEGLRFFLTGADHGRCEKAKRTWQYLPDTAVSLKKGDFNTPRILIFRKENGGFDFVLKPPFFISRKSAVSGSVRMIYKT